MFGLLRGHSFSGNVLIFAEMSPETKVVVTITAQTVGWQNEPAKMSLDVLINFLVTFACSFPFLTLSQMPWEVMLIEAWRNLSIWLYAARKKSRSMMDR
jgi:hypothetical protein